MKWDPNSMSVLLLSMKSEYNPKTSRAAYLIQYLLGNIIPKTRSNIFDSTNTSEKVAETITFPTQLVKLWFFEAPIFPMTIQNAQKIIFDCLFFFSSAKVKSSNRDSSQQKWFLEPIVIRMVLTKYKYNYNQSYRTFSPEKKNTFQFI